VRIWPIGVSKVDDMCLKGHTSNIHAVAFSSHNILVSKMLLGVSIIPGGRNSSEKWVGALGDTFRV